MMMWILIICTFLLIIATAEVQIWGFTLNRHSYWLKTFPLDDKRRINYKSLFYTSAFTSLLSLAVLLTWIYIITIFNLPLHLLLLLYSIGISCKIVLISYLSLIAKLCRLNKYYYPPVTVYLCDKFKKITR